MFVLIHFLLASVYVRAQSDVSPVDAKPLSTAAQDNAIQDVPPQSAEAAATSATNGAMLELEHPAPVIGSLCKARLRGEALKAVLADELAWNLTSAGACIPAKLVLPAQSAAQPVRRFILILEQQHLTDNTLQLVADCGTAAEPFNRLAPLFGGNNSVLGTCSVESSNDKLNFQLIAEKQAVWQELRDGELLRISDLVVQSTAARYLRITMRSQADCSIEKLECWQEPEPGLDMYEVPAAIIQSQLAPISGATRWEVQLADPWLPFARLQLLSAQPGAIRQVTVARLADGQQLAEPGLSTIWANQLAFMDAVRSEDSIQLDCSSSNSPYVLSVNDGKLPPLRISGIRAYAAESWLYFIYPEREPVVLWFGENEEQPGLDLVELNQATEVGIFSQLDFQRHVSIDAQPAVNWQNLPAVHLEPGTRLSLELGLALIAFVAGVLLLRAKPRTAA